MFNFSNWGANAVNKNPETVTDNAEARALAMSQVEMGDLPSALQDRMKTAVGFDEIREIYSQTNTSLLSVA